MYAWLLVFREPLWIKELCSFCYGFPNRAAHRILIVVDIDTHCNEKINDKCVVTWPVDDFMTSSSGYQMWNMKKLTYKYLIYTEIEVWKMHEMENDGLDFKQKVSREWSQLECSALVFSFWMNNVSKIKHSSSLRHFLSTLNFSRRFEGIKLCSSLKRYYDQKNNSCFLWISKLCDLNTNWPKF